MPFVAGTGLHRSFVLRVVFYLWCGFIASESHLAIMILLGSSLEMITKKSRRFALDADDFFGRPVFPYQTIDAGVFYAITAGVFMRAIRYFDLTTSSMQFGRIS